MSKDHFIAQTYLRRFVDAGHNDMLHAYRKSDGKYFPCHTKDVCHEWDGDLNPLLVQNDLLGRFRKVFEPRWKPSIESVLTQKMTPTDLFGVAGYFANLMVCTPTWRRIGVEMHNHHAKEFLSFSKRMKEKHGGNPTLPVDAIEMLERGELSIEHDPDYVKAKVTQWLLDYAWMAYHQNWTIIRNPSARPFLTSDNPVAVYQSPNPAEPLTRFLPVTPTLCLAVRHDRTELPPFNPSLPPKGMIHWATIQEPGVRRINRLVAQCAEDLVFSSVKSDEVAVLVKDNANFRVDVDYVEIPTNQPDAVYQGSVIRVRENVPKKTA